MTFLKIMYLSVLVLLCFAGLSYLGMIWWWADLFAHFRPHLAAMSALLGIVFLAYRRRRAALACAAIIAATLIPVLADLTYQEADVRNPDMRILTWNVYYRHGDPAAGTEMIRARDADVLILAETSPEWRQALSALDEIYPYQLHADSCDDVGCQVTLMSKQPWRVADSRKFVQDTPPVVWATFENPGGGNPLNVIAVHIRKAITPGGAMRQRKQIAALGELVRNLDGDVIMAGDMNAAPSSAAFRSIGTATALSARNISVAPTWPSEVGPFGISIDHFFTRGVENISVRRLGAYGSDHVALEAAVGFGR